MLGGKQAPIAAAALALLGCEPAAAQGSLRVEIVGATHEQVNPIRVRITNLSDKKLQLALPMYGSTLASEPLDVERKNGRRWKEIRLAIAGPRPGASPQVEPGETIEFKFGVFGAGEYRVRVWYLVSPGEVGPPIHRPKYASVVSAPFRVD
jgi:hypothetical protein